MNIRRGLACLIASAGFALGFAATASADIWTPIPSGTGAGISAIDQVSADTLIYGTTSGQILKNGVVKSTSPGYAINDVAMNPSGMTGLAAGTNGRLLISTNGGESWTVKSLTNSSYDQSSVCSNAATGGPAPKTYTPSGNLNAISWASATVAYVVADDEGVVLKTVDGGASFTDVSRKADNTCFVDSGSDILTDVKAVPGSDIVWLLTSNFGTRHISTNGLASTAIRRAESSVNCFGMRPRLGLDLLSPNRAFVTDRCSGTLALGFTQDGGNTFDISQSYVAGNGDDLHGLNDVAVAGGSALAVGNAGVILVDNDGRTAYFQRAGGANARNDWLSVDKLDADHAAVGGLGGALLTTSQATTTQATTPPGTSRPEAPAPPPEAVPVMPSQPQTTVTPVPSGGPALRPISRFRPRFGVRARRGHGNPLGLLSIIRGFSGVPEGGRVEVRCVRDCNWRMSFTMRRTGARKRTSLVLKPPRRLTTRTLIDIRVSSTGLLGRFNRYKFHRTAGIVLPYRITSGCLTTAAPAQPVACP